MRAYIVRQAILDTNQDTLGYEILYQGERVTDDEKKSDISAANAIENFITQFNSDEFLDGKMAFLTFTANLLIKRIPEIFSPQKLVIQIDDDTIIRPDALEVVHQFKKAGYSIAINRFQFVPRYFAFLDVVDIIKINFDYIDTSLENIVSLGKSFNKDIIAYNVNTEDRYTFASNLGIKFMQGSYVSQKLPAKINKIDHLQSNFFQLMVAITKDEPVVDEIEQIISRDVSLTYSLLKIVNSAYFALRHRATTVKQALVILGMDQLKQWIYLLSFRSEDGPTPDELIKTSFLRASFASALQPHMKNLGIDKNEAYLLGMFSTLGSFMDITLEEALREIFIKEEIKTALVEEEGPCAPLYKLILAYESANWAEMKELAEKLEIPMNTIIQKYFECVEEVNKIWKELNEMGLK